MDNGASDASGYVYILEVKDIDLPVCKIGKTSRKPSDRCAEINKSSTGDFIWEVAYEVAVSDCRQMESLVHRRLGPLKQKKREFFNLKPDDAYRALRSILDSQSDVQEITIDQSSESKMDTQKQHRGGTKRNVPFGTADLRYAEMLDIFTSVMGIKGKPFGQLSKPDFGMSDGCEGVQWSLVIIPDEQEKVQLCINLEGMKYSGWPIADFILSELKFPRIQKLEHPEQIYVRFMRDAWQYQARPPIRERHLGGRENIPMSEMDSELWKSILAEALDCLKDKGFRGRVKQIVTLIKNEGDVSAEMWVSPHLNIWTPIDSNSDFRTALEAGITRLKPVREWVSSLVTNKRP